MQLEQTLYHSFLRVTMVVVATILVFQSGLVAESTAVVTRGTTAYLANAVGMSASVEPTQLNEYTAALTQKERELQAREAALSERELAVSVGGQRAANQTTTYLLASVLFILLVLILLNYTLDYLRARENRLLQQTV